jgi:hypothetical protein
MNDFLKRLLNDSRFRLLSALVVTVAAAYGITVTITDEDGPTTITITVNEREDRIPGTGGEAEVEVPERAIEAAEKSDVGNHDDLADETPAVADPEQLREVRDEHDQQVAENPLELTAPLAATSYPGCRSRFVRNQSSRGGVRPRHIVMHYTVSPNRAGRSDVDGITAYFDRASSNASSHFVVDRDGNCNHIVPTYRKAWTQAAANPIAISFEVINTGRESPFMRSRGYARVGYTVARLARQYGIPLRRGGGGCSGSKRGVVEHFRYGACGGGHHDITPFNLSPIIKRAREANCHLYRKTARSKRACLRRA